jgi:phosphatidylglycerophosphate synthase
MLDGGKVSAVRSGPFLGLLSQVMLLVAVAGTVGLTVSGWLVGIACGVGTNVALARGLNRYGASALGPADRVTLVRATLVGAVAALMTAAFVRPAAVPALVTLSVVALVLDAVDGWVARRTGTVSPLGARFDGEVDALLILVLSVYVSNLIGPWVLAIGAARYLFLVAGWLLPWMRAQLPPRYWRKTVAAIQGITLTVAAADVLPRRGTEAALVVALGLLTESFGRDVWWLRRESVRSLVVAERRSIAASPLR